MRSHDNKNEGVETSEIPKERTRKYNVYNIQDKRSGEVNIVNFEKPLFFDPDTSASFIKEDVIDKEYVKSIINKKKDTNNINEQTNNINNQSNKQIIDVNKQIIDVDSDNSIVTSEIEEYTIIQDSHDSIIQDSHDSNMEDNKYVISSDEEEPEEFLENANFFQLSEVSENTETTAEDNEFFSQIQQSGTLESFNNQSMSEIDSSVTKVHKKFSIKTSRAQKKFGDAFSDDYKKPSIDNPSIDKDKSNSHKSNDYKVNSYKSSIDKSNDYKVNSYKDRISDAKNRTFKAATQKIEKYLNSGIQFPLDIKGFEFGWEEISILKTQNWLNDKIVNCYMEYLHEVDETVYVFTSYFYTNLINGGLEKVLKYTADENLFEYRLLFFPIHLQNHWVFACYDVKKNLLEYRDSLFGINNLVLEELSKFIEYEYKRIYDKKLEVDTQIVNNIRGQDNGYDCGVFLLMYAKMRIRNKKDFFHGSMHKYRRIILYEILIRKQVRYDMYD